MCRIRSGKIHELDVNFLPRRPLLEGSERNDVVIRVVCHRVNVFHLIIFFHIHNMRIVSIIRADLRLKEVSNACIRFQCRVEIVG